ncbi:hypothetical protein F7R91_01615 [Streptomyces luteolifulvus]|uniref:Uncharacterized protein n=1 Tax=Streptomyces luteolifulvus TaxID=2615112 RepID=A0A6H9V8Q3_9ACTN|nr:hypothetical protein F7R91_01615 [Streptomyces luteolifulvus]
MIPGSGWETRALRALVLLLVAAYCVRWAYELVRPVVPFLIGGAVVVAVVSAVLAVRQRRRW